MTSESHLSMAIACCVTCLLAEAMKDCPNCAFYPALAIKALHGIKAGDYPPESLAVTRQVFIEAIKAQKEMTK